jgi:transcriptional regulator of acetoin/glycerol metabolism
VLLRYGWPGNVRELRTVVERAGFLSEIGPLGPQALAEAIALGAPGGQRPGPVPLSVRPALGNPHERDRLVFACAESDWDVSRAAAALRMGRSTLYRRLRALGVSLRTLRHPEWTGENSRENSQGR